MTAIAVKDRIESTPSGHIIKLTEDESKLYPGSGWKIARFEDGHLEELFDLTIAQQQEVQAKIDATLEWAKNAKGELWSVMCSCDELVGPEPFSPSSTDDIALLQYRLSENDTFFTME
ncbi:hypothetical protein MD588_13805 [Photobacterium sp. SDRW27]|uniref:hypothetical protein n=1 Tax=Photobacterium obscurum TaxID=2829490 RepID=UPI002244C2BD|nr:hypothetical protein [Photobacterium obscurum]MCW8329882.1 hypothetical protein [Photobacterium obscurum]